MSTTYRQADGSFTSDGPIFAGLASAGDTGTMALAIARSWYAVERVIPTAAAVGFALHETNYKTNERDIETSGHTTGGVFQLDLPTVSPFVLGDAIAAGMPEKDVFTLDDACAVFAARCRYYLARLQRNVDAYNAKNGIAAVNWDSPPSDIWAYVAIAHNQGLGAALLTVTTYGLDWAGYKARNPTVNISMDRGSGIYGDDVISGGPDYTQEMSAPFDASGATIPAPLFGSFFESNLRLALVAALLIAVGYFFLVNKTPLKGTL